MERKQRRLQQELAEALRTYRDAPVLERTAALMSAAERLVDLRETFNQDWLGTSYAYRQCVSEAHGLAGIPVSERKKVGDAVRYHVINVLRSRLTPEQIETLGLKQEAGPARAKFQREVTAQKLAQMTELVGVRADANSVHPSRAVAGAVGLLRAVTEEAAGALTLDEAAETRELLAVLRTEAARVREVLPGSRPRVAAKSAPRPKKISADPSS